MSRRDRAGAVEAVDPRRAAVLAALDDVLDPELDESVTSMGFIKDVLCGDREVEIVFQLPTFWCSANFAFLMASDMRASVELLPFVERATIRLVDHFAARKINRGVAAGEGFATVFAGEAHTNLEEIRRVFRERALFGRQQVILRMLVTRWGIDAALATTIGDLDDLTTHEDQALRAAALRYVAMRRHEGSLGGKQAPAFIAASGEAVTPSGYSAHMRALSSIRGAAQANAEMCRIYLEARATHPVSGCGPNDHKESYDDE